jgi:hypothetical protein
MIFVGAWMHTYNAFTGEELIGELTITSIDDEGDYPTFEVEYVQYKDESGLTKLLFPSSEPGEEEIETTTTYTMYGDTVFMEVHTVKLNDYTALLNFDALYKVTGITADYVEDKDLARNLPAEKRSIYELNGGTDETWQFLKENEESFTFIIDTVQITRQGKDVNDINETFGVYITEEGVLLDEIDK